MRDDEEPSVRLDRPKPLTEMSVEELDAYAERLESELAQVRETARQKRDYLKSVDGLFNDG